MCTSQEVFKKNNFNCIVLEENLETKDKAKEREAFDMGVFEHSVVNTNRPILIDMKDYQKAYRKEYRKKTQSIYLDNSLRYFM
jgi:tRNA A-37 threonylcarbamoyl transferase component Bud32